MRRLSGVVAALWLLVAAAESQARNPHCAGGIQYVSQGMNDKSKGNMDDYQREMVKAIQQLTQCAQEDPKDFEALGYLGWAYAELDSAAQAGAAFQKAIDGLLAKGDPKKADLVVNNRESYYARYFNVGIERINAGQSAYPDMTRKRQNSADETLYGEALKAYRVAEASLQKAMLLKPGEPRVYHNLGALRSFMGDYEAAEKIFQQGLAKAPADSMLQRDLQTVRVQVAQRLAGEQQYDKAISTFRDLAAKEPNNPTHHLMLADAYFRKAQADSGAARVQSFREAGEHYGKASELKPEDADAAFNAGSSYNAASDYAKAEVFLRKAITLRPDDADAMSLLGACLAELGKYKDAVEVLTKAVISKPREMSLHRQLGGVYTKAGKNDRGTDELWMYLALKNGRAAPKPDSSARETVKRYAGSAVEKTLAGAGPPEELLSWSSEGNSLETWIYWSKKQAYTFSNGKQVSKADWSAPDLKGIEAPGVPAAGKKKG